MKLRKQRSSAGPAGAHSLTRAVRLAGSEKIPVSNVLMVVWYRSTAFSVRAS
jgi:hypothetical protein